MPPTHHISNANRHWPSKGSAVKPNGRKGIADQTEMLLFIAGKKTKEAAAKPCARSRWFTFSQKNETKVTAGDHRLRFQRYDAIQSEDVCGFSHPVATRLCDPSAVGLRRGTRGNCYRATGHDRVHDIIDGAKTTTWRQAARSKRSTHRSRRNQKLTWHRPATADTIDAASDKKMAVTQ
jgi:hypothetical protein